MRPRMGKWTRAHKRFVQAWPLAWLSRIGSIQRLPYWTFLQILTCWFFTRGKATAYLQFQRGLRQFSHHSTVPPFLDVRAQRMQRRLAEGPPEVVPGVYHTLTWLDNFLQYMNLTEERHQRTQDSEKHATVIGYAVPRKEAAMVPEELPSPGWNRLPAGTVLSRRPGSCASIPTLSGPAQPARRRWWAPTFATGRAGSSTSAEWASSGTRHSAAL